MKASTNKIAPGTRRSSMRTVATVLVLAAGIAIVSPVQPATARVAAADIALQRARSVPVPAASGSVLWGADMEEGSLADWSFPEAGPQGSFGGGEYNNGGGDSSVTSERAHSGRAAAKMVLNGSGGTRLFRWRELRQNREAIVGAWFNFPKALTLTADPSNGRYLILFQFKSRSSAGVIDPIWYLTVSNPSRGRMRLDLIWWHRTLEGPRPGQSGFRRYTQKVADVPVGRWFELKAELRQSKDFDGLLRIWQDDKLLFDLPNVRTSYANCAFNPWCTSNEWAITNYSDGLATTPAAIYADDARITRPRHPLRSAAARCGVRRGARHGGTRRGRRPGRRSPCRVPTVHRRTTAQPR